MVTMTDQDFLAFAGETEEDLLAQLGLAVGGTDYDPAGGMSTLKKAKNMAWPDWRALGEAFFSNVWPQIKDVLCTAYKEYSEGDKEWIERVAEALLGLINIGSAIAILLVKIAIKKGLDALCAV
ncbi:MAG: hypothetical protein ACK4VY_11410 [Brevundimonas sp.]